MTEHTLLNPRTGSDQMRRWRETGGAAPDAAPTSAKSRLLVAAVLVGVVLLAGGLRFFRLGEWSFTNDETATFLEDQSLFGTNGANPTDQSYRLPRLIPLAYGIQHIDYLLFGRDEWGSRVLPALMGTLGVGLVFLLLRKSQGLAAATAAALLVALSPDHLFHSQANRQYSVSWLCASAAMLIGAAAVRRRSLLLTGTASGVAILSVLTHTLLAVVSAGLTVAVAVAGGLRYGRAVRPLVPVAALGALLAAGLVALLIGRLGGGWNAGSVWGYGVSHGVLAGLLQVGWPTALLALVGAVDVVISRDADGAYWLTWAGVWAAASTLLPLVVVYHPAYGFMLSLGVFVLAGRTIGKIFERLRCWSTVAACAWLAAACLFGLPETASYFADGSRFDFRTAAKTLSDQWRPGDRIRSESPKLLQHYLKGTDRPVGVREGDPLLGLDREARSGGRLWVVLPVSREGRPAALRQWLDANCRRVALIRRQRFDYHEYAVEVYLHPDGAEDQGALTSRERERALPIQALARARGW